MKYITYVFFVIVKRSVLKNETSCQMRHISYVIYALCYDDSSIKTPVQTDNEIVDVLRIKRAYFNALEMSFD